MQDTRNTSSRNSRTNPKTAAVTVKNTGGVKKHKIQSSSAKRASGMHAVRAPKVVTIKKKDKAPFPWSIVVVAALFTCLFLFMIMNYAEVDKYRSEIAALDSQIASMQKNQGELEVELSNKYDLTEIGEYATEQLGMVPGNQINNRKVITIEQGDKIEMHSYDDGEEGGFGFLLTGLGEVIRDFIN